MIHFLLDLNNYIVRFTRQRIKDEIAKDREDKKRQTEAGRADAVAAPAVQQVVAEKRQYDECKIQIRLTDGKSIVQTFKATEPLASVNNKNAYKNCESGLFLIFFSIFIFCFLFYS